VVRYVDETVTISKAPPRWSRGLVALLGRRPAVLTSPTFLQRGAPFSSTQRWPAGQPMRVGLKGAGGSANPDDASTAT